LSLILQELLQEQLRQLQEQPRVHQPLELLRVHQQQELHGRELQQQELRVHQYDPQEQLL
jgi:hypothetical protein